ncbi:MAG TPA: hypothetical protein VJ824_13035 [Bacillota bacterium]|nr:hypothetical protein [Bacillota bacterium]
MKVKNELSHDTKKKLNEMVKQKNDNNDPSTEREWREVMGEFNRGLRRGKGGAWK